jgi:hypothetical protein
MIPSKGMFLFRNNIQLIGKCLFWNNMIPINMKVFVLGQHDSIKRNVFVPEQHPINRKVFVPEQHDSNQHESVCSGTA